MNSPGGHTTADDGRIYGFDPNPHWQEDKDHYDNQKINGLTFPRCIRQSAFTQKLDIEGCDPLKLPVAALLYQQANNFWLRKLAHGREVYLIPTGDIAAVVFMTELLTQLRNKGVDIDKVASCKARQDGKLLDKTNNTKYAAQQVADLIHGWVPTRTADPDTQHELTQLRSQIAQLRQQLGDTTGEPASPSATGPSASSPLSAPIHAALLRNSQSPAPPAPPGFDPSSLLVTSTTVNPWIVQNKPTSLAVRAFNKWLKELNLSEPKRKVLYDNFAKMEEWWEKQPAEALDTIERVAATMGIPVNLMGKNYEALNRHQPHQLTSASPTSETQAQGASIPFAYSPFDDSHHLHFDPLHHDSQRPSFSGLSHHPNTHDGADNPPRSSTQSQAEVNFGRVC